MIVETPRLVLRPADPGDVVDHDAPADHDDHGRPDDDVGAAAPSGRRADRRAQHVGSGTADDRDHRR